MDEIDRIEWKTGLNIRDAIGVTDQMKGPYQPERSKREEAFLNCFCPDMTTEDINPNLEKFGSAPVRQDYLDAMRCSEHGGNVVREVR